MSGPRLMPGTQGGTSTFKYLAGSDYVDLVGHTSCYQVIVWKTTAQELDVCRRLGHMILTGPMTVTAAARHPCYSAQLSTYQWHCETPDSPLAERHGGKVPSETESHTLECGKARLLLEHVDTPFAYSQATQGRDLTKHSSEKASGKALHHWT